MIACNCLCAVSCGALAITRETTASCVFELCNAGATANTGINSGGSRARILRWDQGLGYGHLWQAAGQATQVAGWQARIRIQFAPASCSVFLAASLPGGGGVGGRLSGAPLLWARLVHPAVGLALGLAWVRGVGERAVGECTASACRPMASAMHKAPEAPGGDRIPAHKAAAASAHRCRRGAPPCPSPRQRCRSAGRVQR